MAEGFWRRFVLPRVTRTVFPASAVSDSSIRSPSSGRKLHSFLKSSNEIFASTFSGGVGLGGTTGTPVLIVFSRHALTPITSIRKRISRQTLVGLIRAYLNRFPVRRETNEFSTPPEGRPAELRMPPNV